nr:MAG TPA: hypothetical protein [Caudoviricetes sp.]
MGFIFFQSFLFHIILSFDYFWIIVDIANNNLFAFIYPLLGNATPIISGVVNVFSRKSSLFGVIFYNVSESTAFYDVTFIDFLAFTILKSSKLPDCFRLNVKTFHLLNFTISCWEINNRAYFIRRN